MHPLTTIVFVVVLWGACSAQNATNVTYTCVSNGDGLTFHVRFERDENEPKLIRLSYGDCEMKLRNNVIQIPARNNMSNLTCGVMRTNHSNVYTAKYTASSIKCDCIAKGDIEFEMTCDSNTTGQELVATLGRVDGKKTKVTPSKKETNLKLSVLNSNGDVLDLSKNIRIGSHIKLRASMMTSGDGAKGMRIVGCTASSSDGKVSLDIIEKGCTSGNYKIFEAGYGFKLVNGSNNDTFVSESPAFKLFRFMSGNTVEFRCKVNLCYNDEDCRYSCAKEEKKRGKRSAVNKDRTYKVDVVLKVGEPEANVPVSKTSNKQDQCKDSKNVTSSSYLIALIIVGSVLFVTLLVTIATYIALSRKHRVNDKL